MEGYRLGRLTLLVAPALLGEVYVGFMISVLSLYSKDVTKQIFGIDSEFQLGLANGIIFLTGSAGAYATGPILDRLSRVQTLQVSNAIALLGGILVVAQPSSAFLLAGRAVQGLAFGIHSAAIPVLIKELSPRPLSGLIGMLNQAFIVVGVISVYLVHAFLIDYDRLPDPLQWRFWYSSVYLCLALQAVLLAGPCGRQSPKYFIKRGRPESARALISYLYHPEAVEAVLRQKLEDSEVSLRTEGHDSAGTRRRLLLAYSLPLTHQLSGINVLNTYVNDIFSFNPFLQTYIGTLTNLLKLCACLVTASLSLRFGRRPLFLVGVLGIVLGNVFLGSGFLLDEQQAMSSVLKVVGSCVVFASFGSSVGPIIWQYLPEIVQPSTMGKATLLLWFVSFLTVTLYPPLSKQLGNAAVFLALAGLVFLIWVFQWQSMQETKGFSEAQVLAAFEPTSSLLQEEAV